MRIDEGRFVCAANRNHKESLRDATIFHELRTPMTLSYRLLFHDFVQSIPMGVAAHRNGCDMRTVS
jgi:hypothetical protein